MRRDHWVSHWRMSKRGKKKKKKKSVASPRLTQFNGEGRTEQRAPASGHGCDLSKADVFEAHGSGPEITRKHPVFSRSYERVIKPPWKPWGSWKRLVKC